MPVAVRPSMADHTAALLPAVGGIVPLCRLIHAAAKRCRVYATLPLRRQFAASRQRVG
jgi:hypothetical protein